MDWRGHAPRVVAAMTRQTCEPLADPFSGVGILSLTGKCVVAGNVRRTAEIAFGNPNSTEYIDLKGRWGEERPTAIPLVVIYCWPWGSLVLRTINGRT